MAEDNLAERRGTRSVERLTLLAFIGAVLIGGGNFLAVKFSNEDLEPLFGAALRFGSASIVLFALAVALRLPLPTGRALWGAVIYGLLGFGLAYALLYIALVGLSAGTASVIMAAVPLVTLTLAVVHRQERFTPTGIAGGFLALVGIGVISAGAIGGDIQIGYLLASICAVFAVAESAVVIKAFPRGHPITTNAIGMTVGTILLVISSLVSSEKWAVPASGRTWLVLLWLVVAGSVGLFVLFLYVIARWTASASAYALTLMPVVAVALGTLFADEDLTIQLVVGGALVIAAVYVGTLTKEPSPTGEEPVALVPEPSTSQVHD